VYLHSQVDVSVVCTVTSIRAGYSGLKVGCLSTVVPMVVESGADAMRELRLVLLWSGADIVQWVIASACRFFKFHNWLRVDVRCSLTSKLDGGNQEERVSVLNAQASGYFLVSYS
jgi:hypothetical protein